jgi:hypothetical protein
MPRDLVEGARQLDDYSVHAEVYRAEVAERKLAKVRARRTHLENAALAFSRAWAELEGRRQTQRERETRAMVDSEQQRYAPESRSSGTRPSCALKTEGSVTKPTTSGRAFIIKEIYRAQEGPADGSPGVSPRPGVFGGFCQWCSWGGHGSDECTDPHFHCTRGRGCIVPPEHPNWETRHRCMASPEWEGNRRTNEPRVPPPRPVEPLLRAAGGLASTATRRTPPTAHVDAQPRRTPPVSHVEPSRLEVTIADLELGVEI